jgi:hypothetical protein
MSLLTYEDVRPWARTIKNKVTQRLMPPWHIERNVGIQQFKDDPSLSDAEIATIASWVDAGAPRGNAADMPPPATFPDDETWHIGEPDLIVEIPKPHVVPASGGDLWIDYIADSGLAEDRYLQAVEAKPGPGARAVVHHLLTYLIQDVDEDEVLAGRLDDRPTNSESFLNEFAVGKNGDILPDGTAKLVKAGAKIRFNLHYHPSGKETVDRARVGLKFYPKGYTPKYVVTSHRIRTGVGNDWVLNRERIEDLLLRAGHKIAIDEPAMPTGALIAENPLHSAAFLSIPPNSVVTHERYWPLPKPALIVSFQPHMHFRGSKMLLEAIHPDGRREVLTSATHYEQNWQITYKYKTPHLFPAGTILHTVSIHDNTANNRHNPDPTAWIGWGSRTMDEMGHGWTDIAFLTHEQYQEELAARRAQRRTSTEAQK